MKNIVATEKLVGFLNQKNSSDLKFRKDSVVERKEMFLDKVESINEEDGTCQCIITTQGTDRQGDIVISRGIDTTEFKKIPSIFLNHDYSLLPIAKCEELVHKDGYITATVKFVLGVPAIKNIFELVKAGVLKGVSIGFAANEVVLRGTKAFDDVCKELGLDAQTYEKTQRIIKSWTMYEFSIVSLPANSECYIKSLTDAKITVDPELIKYLGVKSIPAKEEIIIKTEDTPDAGKPEEAKKETPVVEDPLKEIEGEAIEKELVLKPFPNEHAARQEDPGKYDKFRRKNDKFGSGLHAIFGITSDGKTELQSIRADSKKYTVEEFRAWLEEHKFKTNIEAAAEKAIEPYIIEIKPHVKRYIEVIQTPEEVEEYINKCVEARIRGKTRISII
jgi:hypothetical protein